jgi:hypothetical protein
MMVPVLVFTLAAPAAVAVWQAETFQSAAFAPSTGALWAPAALNASRVFLRAATPIVAALALAATPLRRMRATSPGHDHGTRPVAAHRRLPSGHPPTTFNLVEISQHLATCHHPPLGEVDWLNHPAWHIWRPICGPKPYHTH